ncbi:hypothetical protein ACTWQI_06170 [Streptomyces sp. KR80]
MDGSTGTVELPRHLDWGPRYLYDLGDEADVILMYEPELRKPRTGRVGGPSGALQRGRQHPAGGVLPGARLVVLLVV